jgi:hypothetical protein
VTIGDGTGAITITDDDVVPSVAVDDVSVDEGDTGTTPATFTLSQTAATALDTTVDFVVVDGTAVIGEDVAAASGTATIPAGETSVAVSVDVLGDTVDEFDETFTVELSNAANATIGDTEATGTIVDDEATVSSITVKAKKTAKKVVAKGTLEPATSDREVLVILQKKVKGGRWKAVAKKRVAVTQLLDRDADGHEDGIYQAAFKRPATGRYRLVAKVGATLDATAAVGMRGFKI